MLKLIVADMLGSLVSECGVCSGALCDPKENSDEFEENVLYLFITSVTVQITKYLLYLLFYYLIYYTKSVLSAFDVHCERVLIDRIEIDKQ